VTGALGRRPPSDWDHTQKWPLTSTALEALPQPQPMTIGINWYHAFDTPEQDAAGHWWVARDGNLGPLRGGHCVCLKGRRIADPASYWKFYDQGAEGACVGFGSSRMMSLLNRKRYDAPWLYREGQKVDEYEDTPPGEGTSVRAGMDVLRTRGHRVVKGHKTGTVDLDEGIRANRWAVTLDDVLRVLGYQDVGYVDFLNSWGVAYPHLTRMPVEPLERLLGEDGEFAVVTDR
jgi:hypothetical protein